MSSAVCRAGTRRDAVTGNGAAKSYPVDLPATVGGSTAYVGFTAGTGELFAPIDVLDWKYLPTDNWDPESVALEHGWRRGERGPAGDSHPRRAEVVPG